MAGLGPIWHPANHIIATWRHLGEFKPPLLIGSSEVRMFIYKHVGAHPEVPRGAGQFHDARFSQAALQWLALVRKCQAEEVRPAGMQQMKPGITRYHAKTVAAAHKAEGRIRFALANMHLAVTHL